MSHQSQKKESRLLKDSLRLLGSDIVQDALFSSFIVNKSDVLHNVVASIADEKQNLMSFDLESNLNDTHSTKLNHMNALWDLNESIQVVKYCHHALSLDQFDHILILRGALPLLCITNEKHKLGRCIGLDIYDYRRQLLRRKIAHTKTYSNRWWKVMEIVIRILLATCVGYLLKNYIK
jgi:hypothetical protein